ncbi:MAG: alpha/beta fold hydrolase [Lachnospiraceae bacterium]
MKHKFKIVVTLSAFVTITLHILNKILGSFYSIKSTLINSSNHYYEWRFGKIHYIRKGTGSPLLLIHDLTVGSSQYEFHNLINSLAKTNEVFAIDLLGYGLSDKPNMTYTNYLYVQQIIDFIKNVIGHRVDIIATGDATPIAVMACHNDPEVIRKMIFINPQSLYQANQIPSKQTKLLKLMIELPVFGTFIYYLLTTRTNILNAFKNEYIYHVSHIKAEDVDSYLESAHRTDYHAKYSFSSYVANYMNTNYIHALKEINNSIYIIAGKEQSDITTIIENYLYYNTSIEVVYISNTKHLPHLEDSEAVLTQLQYFLHD